MSTWPQHLGHRPKVSWQWGGSIAQNPKGLSGWVNVVNQAHLRSNDTAATGVS